MLFLTNKGNFSNAFYIIEKDVVLISNKRELVEHFNENYVNTIEMSCRKKPTFINSDNMSSDEVNVKQIVKSHSSHPSNIKNKKVDAF